MKLFGKLSKKEIVARLSGIHILVADADQRMSKLVRDILKNVGFINTSLARDGKHALEIIKAQTVDVLITDWRMEPMDGVSLIKYLRTDAHSPDRFIPIIMLTGNAEREHVETARDIGVTEFVAKPFSARTLCNRIALLIDNPRNFILSPNYTGPDRRRRLETAPAGRERRSRRDENP